MRQDIETIREFPSRLRPAAGFAGTLGGAVRRAVGTVLLWQQRARERHALATIDDHGLKDLGLSRADVARESDKPFWLA